MADDDLNAWTPTLPANKVTLEQMEARIVGEDYFRMHETVTICSLRLDNGYSVRGESACVDPANYDRAIGEQLARMQAIGKLWPLFGFLLAEARFRQSAAR